MQQISSIEALRTQLADIQTIAFVPTMGNLHDGHLELVKLAKQHAKTVVVSIFVNPLQFGPNEDFANYPRTLEADCEKLRAAGADFAFTPSVDEMYPTEQTMVITPPPIAQALCGASRQGHFDGVATVVMKLFNIVRPTVAVFGKKDFQQLFIIKALVQQFNLPIEIIAGETYREESGLAMSSRNGYLSPAQKVEAPRLFKTLEQVAGSVKKETQDYTTIENQATQYLTQLGWIVDYISIRSQKTLLPPQPQEKNLIVLAAARQGKTRLIDNLEISL